MFAILGPTASGKSDLTLRLATELGAAVISVDSMQVYRGMDIGTAKPSAADRALVRHHMIDVADPEEAYTAARFQREGRAALEATAKTVIISGGSGLHFRALVDPLRFPPHDQVVRARLEALAPEEATRQLLAIDADAGCHVDLRNPRRVVRALEASLLTGVSPSGRAEAPDAARARAYQAEIDFAAVGVDPGSALPARVERRFDAMLEVGLLDEVASLRHRLGATARQAVGYRELLPVVAGDRSAEEGRRLALRATLALGRRQRTFFRRDPRIRWITWSDDPESRFRQARDILSRGADRCAS